MLAGGGVPNLQPSSTLNLSGKGAGFAAFRHGVVVGKVIVRLKAGAAASAARIIATDNNNSVRLMRHLPLRYAPAPTTEARRYLAYKTTLSGIFVAVNSNRRCLLLRWPYSPSFREWVFSETGFPLQIILENPIRGC